MTEFGLKELYEVLIKTTYPIELKNKIIEAGETIAYFDKIQIAAFGEERKITTANGGFDNRARVFWESTKDLVINFTQGIFSKEHLALMTNSRLITEENSQMEFYQRESSESDENGIISFKFAPLSEGLFIYNKNGEKLKYTKVDDFHYLIESPFTDVILDYKYIYTSDFTILTVGQMLTSGYLTLQGKTRVKDDITGHDHTGIITIPKMKLMSDLSMRLGKGVDPIVGRLDALAIPTGPKGRTVVMELALLTEDIDSDM